MFPCFLIFFYIIVNECLLSFKWKITQTYLNWLTAHNMFSGNSRILTQLKQASLILMVVAFVPRFLFSFVSIINCGFKAWCHYNLTSVTLEYRPVNSVPETHDVVHFMACEAVQNSAE